MWYVGGCSWDACVWVDFAKNKNVEAVWDRLEEDMARIGQERAGDDEGMHRFQASLKIFLTLTNSDMRGILISKLLSLAESRKESKATEVANLAGSKVNALVHEATADDALHLAGEVEVLQLQEREFVADIKEEDESSCESGASGHREPIELASDALVDQRLAEWEAKRTDDFLSVINATDDMFFW